MDLHKIVVLSRQAEIHNLAQRAAREVYMADEPADALEITRDVKPNLILLDKSINPDYISEFFDETDKNTDDVPVVIVGDGSESDIEQNFQFNDTGVYEYLSDKDDFNGFELIIKRIKSRSYNKSDLRNDRQSQEHLFADELASSVQMVGRSDAIKHALKMIKLIAAGQCNPILVLGETGTGKELVARAIHAQKHPNEKFVAVNCAALTTNLLESELFGHVKGSFTGADHEKTGLLELAGTGTLLLDEISEMPLDLQAKLLRVLEEKKFRKVGGTKTIDCKATIIAASNRNLKIEVENKRFRQDLYYRLNICPIALAPLRSPQRRGDITFLVKYFLKSTASRMGKGKQVKSLTMLALESLEQYDWPGNIRELRNVIERAVLLESSDKIGLNSIIYDPLEFCNGLEKPTDGPVGDFSLEKAEKKLIARALQETNWQKTRAASLLGITRATLYAKVKQYNISKESDTAVSNINEDEPLYSMSC